MHYSSRRLNFCLRSWVAGPLTGKRALNVITVVQGVPSLDDTSVLLDDVRKLLASLNGHSLSHIRRSANHVVHL
ncbi:hypothetical protein TIFTF001_030054 [Ficus carica]|uniref:Uncharacterized protein n=1 Tax=Ficus carica TaxID=3494 RepID=A0AA88J3N2_FICCA|nr:hypothetical protein TIFTF001_030054 [Ficus carica]